MANKKTNKYVQTKKPAKPQPKKSAQAQKKVEAVKKPKVQTAPKKQKTVRTKKVSINSIPQPITYTEEVKAYKIGKYTVKKSHLWIAAAVVLVLLCVLF